jgi:hypothetical protein
VVLGKDEVAWSMDGHPWWLSSEFSRMDRSG